MAHSRTITVTAVLVVLLGVLIWQYIDGAWTSIQLAFADEQTEIFSQMVDKATESLEQEPPDVKAAVGFLEYTHDYYPSGTKQTSGSIFDRIVERSRSLAESRIIEMLRVATGEDRGTDAEAWVREFSSQGVADEFR